MVILKPRTTWGQNSGPNLLPSTQIRTLFILRKQGYKVLSHASVYTENISNTYIIYNSKRFGSLGVQYFYLK